MHVCWGNYEGPHDHDIPLEKIIDVVLKARPATILFEAANPRHEHEWIVWRDAAIPGRQGARARPDRHLLELRRAPRADRPADRALLAIVGKDRVIASTDCGFGTFAGYGKIDPAVAWKKLAALREGARLAVSRAGRSHAA